MSRRNFAVIGRNFVVDSFLEAAAERDDVRLLAVYSRREDTGRAFAEKHGAERVYTDLSALAADGDLDFVYVASPNLCHEAQTVALLRGGKHVLVEKPASPTRAGFDRMCKAADESGRVLMEAMMPAHMPAMQVVRDWLPRIAPVRTADFSYCQYSSRYDKFKAGVVENAFDPTLGNGALMVQKTHRPLVRFVKNKRNWSLEPAELKAKWRKFEPESFDIKDGALTLSGIAYYYALELHDALGIPVGIVDSTWGGSPIEAWLPRDEIAKRPELAKIAAYQVSEKKDWKKNPDCPQCWGAEMQPGVLFDGMVAAYAPMAMRGLIWYQGCSNPGDGNLYAVKMHVLCDGWSNKFENPGMKLYFCALAPFTTTWFGLVGAQTNFANEEPRAAIAYLSDVGNPNDIHPNDKHVPAMRLALHALKRDYGFSDIQDESPSFESAKVEGDVVSITFKDAKDIYIYNRDYTLNSGFELAGEDGKFVKAAIQKVRKDGGYLGAIGGNVLELKAEGVAVPKKVRYLHEGPVKGAIYNEASLPLGAFQADL